MIEDFLDNYIPYIENIIFQADLFYFDKPTVWLSWDFIVSCLSASFHSIDDFFALVMLPYSVIALFMLL